MQRFIVRVEVVNLMSSVFDTDDLSSIRGGGYASLLIPALVLKGIVNKASKTECLDPVFDGASQAVGILTVTDDEATDPAPSLTAENIEARVTNTLYKTPDAFFPDHVEQDRDNRSLRAVLPYLTVLVAVVDWPEQTSYLEASRSCLARLRRRQFMSPTLDLFADGGRGATRPCAVDGVRPGVQTDTLGGEKRSISNAVAVRRTLGRALRDRIYAEILGKSLTETWPEGVPPFAASLADLVNEQPGLPPSLSGKIAVVHMDGNTFTAKREKAVRVAGEKAPNQERLFSETVKSQRAAFLKRLLDALLADPRMIGPEGRLRFETLLWGGDEAVFVLPAWKVMDLLLVMAKAFSDPGWVFNGQPLTHGTGILVCHHKMPIATARDLADSLGRSAKNAVPEAARGTVNTLSLATIESIEPIGSLSAYRKALHGTDRDTAFALTGTESMDDFVTLGRRLSAPKSGFPRSQIQTLIERLTTFTDKETKTRKVPSEAETRTVVEQIARRTILGDGPEVKKTVSDHVQDLTSSLWGESDPQAPWVKAMRIAALWDLFHPFSETTRGETT
ncbi:Cas10/Cmr2 second palm domain-containing protein [Rhodospirillum sp. A1_3_36]|uniref:Cas10/Cmr2 second palm domain-containing protein n=1 Tax=Rhodospirillum sp. A1_3_36 TaxID=3391666 RepID=UPI0039A6852F